ncbi:MAG: TIGR00296 family protein [Methanosarcinaceae archaeon]|nr:TIGR00296 family protein [Methanosarcinaceae archaeon]
MAVQLARDTVSAVFEKRRIKDFGKLPLIFYEKRGVFVTLTISGELRGCIGFAHPYVELGDAIRQVSMSAAFEDPRFLPLTEKEFKNTLFEVTILTAPEELTCPFTEFVNNIEIGKHGLIVEYGERKGLLLPQVAVEHNFDVIDFLCETSKKAGLAPTAWKYGSKVYRFEGQVFKETTDLKIIEK